MSGIKFNPGSLYITPGASRRGSLRTWP